MRIGNRRENKIKITWAFGERDKFIVFISGSSKSLKIEFSGRLTLGDDGLF